MATVDVRRLPFTTLALRVLLVLAASAQGSCSDDRPTSADVLAACRKDPSSECCTQAECTKDSICYFSYVCGQESDRRVTCGGTPEGDRKCHARCDQSQPCGAGQACESVEIFEGTDYSHARSICLDQ